MLKGVLMMPKKSTNKKTKKIKKNKWKDARTYFVGILCILTASLVFQVWDIGVLPMKYFMPIILVLLVIVLGLSWLQYAKNINKVNRRIGKGLIVLVVLFLGVGNVFAYQARAALGKVNSTDEYEMISVVVMKESKAEELEDVKDGTFAITDTMDQENTQKTITDINKQLDQTIQTQAYDNLNTAADSLYASENDAMILNEAYRSLLEDEHPAFDSETKVIYTFKIKKEIAKIGSKVNVTKEPFNVYISGIDTYGPIATKSRSDVNMIATVNPVTKQILLTSIPRDYYIAQTCQNNQKDKLTHTGIFGVECTVESMQQFTGITMNYYARVNFSSLETIVDAIGGIDIYNEVSFTSGVDGTYMEAGNVHLNGNAALKFARERYAYADGDKQRGRNQMIVISGIISKATSPAIITGYSGIMNAIGDSFQTNMESNEMTSLIKKQIDEGGSWNIVQQSVDGSGENGVWSPANQTYSYMMHPDMDSVNQALVKIQKVIDGEIISE